MNELPLLTATWGGLGCLFIFLVGYFFIIKEQKYHLNKSIPALLTGTSMFFLVAYYFFITGRPFDILGEKVEHVIFEIANIFFFLFVAMTYIEVLHERKAFDVLEYKIAKKNLSSRYVFWLLGMLAFLLSPLVNNITTALILGTVLMGFSKNKKFLLTTGVFIVIGANFGGSFSPFGNITTLIAWVGGVASFFEFFVLFFPALSGFVTIGYLLEKKLPKKHLKVREYKKKPKMKSGAKVVMAMGLLSILLGLIGYQVFHLPAMVGMMFGLGLLEFFTYELDRKGEVSHSYIYKEMKKVQMDTLLFFFGIIFAVGALSVMGYLLFFIDFYEYFGVVWANIFMGIISAFVDNIPLMSAVLQSNIDMDLNGWLLLTLCVGAGGSLISIGSAAGVAMMGKMKGIYTFKSHLKFIPIIFLGYLVSVGVYLLEMKFLGIS